MFFFFLYAFSRIFVLSFFEMFGQGLVNNGPITVNTCQCMILRTYLPTIWYCVLFEFDDRQGTLDTSAP